ncbi:MAG TPA: hypothetical protein VGQ09_16850 [Chitinophagaceae bacterium]|jgi:hypothetical protein|nr:hypothetical protein [Chitinophagaceae bacterium]
MKKNIPFFIIVIVLVYCNSAIKEPPKKNSEKTTIFKERNKRDFDTTVKTIHVLVALCDNKYQGIVPVPAKIGNGQDPDNNLYWGCSSGVRTYFKKSKSWTLLKSYKIDNIKLERLIFKNKKANFYLIADAYDGKFIKDCTIDFLKACSGQMKETVGIESHALGIYGNSKLIAYIGHDGLMDFSLAGNYSNEDSIKRDAIILACISKKYFSPHLASTKAYPLIWTTGLMCPEAYTLHDGLESYINNESNEHIKTIAAAAYSKYQKCSLKASKNLLVTGW